MKACALTGHRDLPEKFDKNAVYDELERFLRDGYDYFYCGMAQGFDLTALECLVTLRKKYRFRVEACIPYAGQEEYFSQKEKALYRSLIGWCDKVTVLCDGYREGCFLIRDRYMVDGADAVLAYCKRETGGTAYTVRYAQKKGLPVRFVD